jgi:hypothetical protein
MLVAVVLMLPRLADPHFGFFDDTSSIQTAQGFLRGDWSVVLEGERGRARPMYWLLYTAIYAVAGAHPFWFFVGNTILLCLIVVGVILLARSLGADRREAWFAGMLFVLSGPVLENVYTLSKPELQQLLWIVASLLLARAAERSGGSSRILKIGLAAVAVLAACNTKETAFLLLPISLVWLGLGWMMRRARAEGPQAGYLRDPALAIASLAGVLLYFGLSATYLTPARLGEGYGSGFAFDVARLITTARIWADWLNRDYLFLLPLALLAVLRYRLLRPRLGHVLMWITWMAAWVGVYLPWIFTPEYYLLPLAVGAALLGGILMSLALDAARGPARAWRLAAAGTLALSASLWLLTLPNEYTNGRFQLAIDSANAEMVDFLSANMPKDGVVLVNLPEDGEYAVRLPGIIESFGGRSDLTVGILTAEDPADPAWAKRQVALVLPVFENQFYPSVRTGFHIEHAVSLNEAAQTYLGSLTPAYRATRSFRLFASDAARIFCPVVPQLGYCAVPNTPFDRRVLEYGWEIYLLPPD